MVGLMACNTDSKHQAQVPMDMVTDLTDSLKSLRSYQKELEKRRDSAVSTLRLRSVRDIEFHEFVFDHPTLGMEFPNGRCGVLADSTFLYSGANADDTVIATLTFKATFILEAIEGSRAQVTLYTQALSGYIDLKDIYTYRTTLSPGPIEVMIGQKAFAPAEKPALSVVLSKYRQGEKLGVFELSLERNEFKVLGIGTCLKNGPTIFGLVQSFGDKETMDYYHSNGSNFIKVLEKENRRLEDGYQYSSVYFPVKYQNGDIRHVLSGPFEGAFNIATGKVNSVELPDSIGLEPESTVIVRSEAGKMAVGNPRYEPFEKENEMLLLQSVQTDYYQWDGERLTLHTSLITQIENNEQAPGFH